MWTEHGESVTLHDPSLPASQQDIALSVIFRRQQAMGQQLNGIGAESFEGEASCVVRVSEMAAKPGANSVLTREGEAWEIRFVERQDEWTWVYHLSRPNGQLAMRPGVRL